MNDLMVDIETLGTTPDAAIISLGAVWFDPRSDEMGAELYRVIDPRQRRHIDPDTVLWWFGQPSGSNPFARRAAMHPLPDALEDLSVFIAQNTGPVRLWSQGAAFDGVLLEDAFRQHGRVAPWKFWDVRDTRTVYDMAGDDDRTALVAHHALEDAKAQARRVQRCFAKLGIATVAESAR